MVKRIFALMLVLACVCNTAISSVNASEDSILIFEDDFERGNIFWSILPDWTMAAGSLSSPVTTGCNAYLNAQDVLNWRDYTLEFEFNIEEYNMEVTHWTGFIMRKDILFYFTEDGVRLLQNGQDTSLFDIPIRKNTDYCVKAVASDRYISLYLKEKDAKYYMDLGTITDDSTERGSVYFRSICTRTNINSVKVYIPSSSDLYFANMGVVKLGENKLDFINRSGKKINFAVDNPQIAQVKADALSVLSKGAFLVKASDESGNTVCAGIFGASVEAERIDFAMGYKEVYVGDSMDIKAYYSPSNTDAKKTFWQSSDEEVVGLFGTREASIGMIAKKAGVSDVTATLAFGGSVAETAKITIRVKEKPPAGSASAVLAATGEKLKIPEYYFGIGMGDRCAMNDGTPYASPYMFDLVKESKFKNVRIPGGGSSQRFDYRTGQESSRQYEGEFQGFSLADLYSLPESIQVPAVYCLNTTDTDFTPAEIVEQITQLKKHTTSPVFVELSNEIYSSDEVNLNRWPTVADFASDMQKYYDAIKAAHPDVQIATVALGKDMEKRILADPNNSAFVNEDDWEFTQAGRIAHWNSTLGDHQTHYDAVANHPYTHQSKMSYVTQDEYMRDNFVFNQDFYLNLLLIDRDYKGKPQWLSEWGDIVEAVFAEPNPVEQGRKNTMFDVGMAVSCAERILIALKTGCVEMMSYHCLQDSCGFGLASIWAHGEFGNFAYSPRYHIFKEVGQYLDRNSYFWDIADVDVKSTVEIWPWNNELQEYRVNLPQVSAYGLGDEEKINSVAFVNHTNETVTVSVGGLELKRKWAYGGPEPFPDFMVKKANVFAYAPTNDEVPLPDVFEEEFSREIILPPYSMVFADAGGTAEMMRETVYGKISKLNAYELNHTVVLRPEKNTAYVNNVKTVVDENTDVKPVVTDGRTLLPLRFVSESMGAQVTYDDATGKITVALGADTAAFTLGDVKYHINGKEMTLDVAPRTYHGRTMIPLRALAEALGKTVYWDDRGLIVVSNVSTSFHEPYYKLDPQTYTEILALFDGEN